MNFWKSSKGGRGRFLIQKFILQILDLYIGFFWTFCENNLQYNFPKMKGEGTKAIWIFSENSSNLVALSSLKEFIIVDFLSPKTQTDQKMSWKAQIIINPYQSTAQTQIRVHFDCVERQFHKSQSQLFFMTNPVQITSIGCSKRECS